jgi:predicted dehydrogenase
MTSRPTLSRRHFLRLSTTLAAGIYAAPAFVRAQAQQGKLRLAVIGSQGKGSENINQLTKVGFEIVALCDVDSKRLDAGKAQVEKITGATFNGKTYNDYRKLYDDASAFDAVVVSTPDHHHFPATIRALKAKKHVYCEKPLVHTIGEVRKIYAAAKEAGVATQMGNQGNASEDLRVTTEWIKSGAIGKGHRSAFLVQSADLATGHHLAERSRSDSRWARLGSLARACGGSSVLQGLPSF